MKVEKFTVIDPSLLGNQCLSHFGVDQSSLKHLHESAARLLVFGLLLLWGS